MIMKLNMKFKPEEWNQLSAEQKNQICVAKNIPPRLPNPPPTLHVNAMQVLPTITPTPNVPVPADSHLRQVLSNRNVRTSTADTNQVTVNGQAYQHITNTVNVSYQIQNAARHTHKGAFIDGGC
jgi:hypothetical protein